MEKDLNSGFEHFFPTSVTLLNERFIIKVKNSVKQADEKLGRSYPPCAMSILIGNLLPRLQGPKNNRERKFVWTFICVTPANLETKP